MGPSGYCHRKPNGVWIHLLPRAPAIRSATNGLPSASAQIRAFYVPLYLTAAMLSAPSKPHRLELCSSPDQGVSRRSTRNSFRFSAFASSTNHWLRDSPVQGLSSSASLAVSRSLFLFPVPFSLFPSFQDQALDRLVSSSSIRYRTFTDDLSTLSSSRGLTCFLQWQFYSPGGLHA